MRKLITLSIFLGISRTTNDGMDEMSDKYHYVELHAHSFYSFGEGASHIHELLSQAYELNYSAMALTDHNMCGSLEFSN